MPPRPPDGPRGALWASAPAAETASGCRAPRLPPSPRQPRQYQPGDHDFGFTPALSLYVACRNRPEIDRLFAALADGGQVLMALDDHGFSDRFGWVNDRFGVSWQLNVDRAPGSTRD